MVKEKDSETDPFFLWMFVEDENDEREKRLLCVSRGGTQKDAGVGGVFVVQWKDLSSTDFEKWDLNRDVCVVVAHDEMPGFQAAKPA